MSSEAPSRTKLSVALSLIAIGFGVVTIKAGGGVLLGGPEARAAAGDYVPFVVWFNFVAGFAYVAAGVGLWKRHRWAVRLAAAIAGATAMVFLAFGAHVLMGGAYEPRTVAAMTLRFGLWLAIAIVGFKALLPARAAADGGAR